MSCYHLLIKGKVQGVFFRQTSKNIAAENRLTGWIKNTEDGHVEAKICGDETAAQNFIAWCRSGPDRARVEDVQVTSIPAETFEGYKVIRDSL